MRFAALATCVGLLILAGTSTAAAAPGDINWTHYFSGQIWADPHEVLIASNGRVFVTGTEDARTYNNSDYVTQSYSPTGDLIWHQHFAGAYDHNGAYDTDVEGDMAFGPNQHRLYVTGSSEGKNTGFDWATVAYRADGTQLWARRYDGPVSHADWANSVAASATTGRVFVTGLSRGKHTNGDTTTVAYSASGDRLWVRRPEGVTGSRDTGTHLLVAPTGRRLYVIASCHSANLDANICIIAYRGNGSRIWNRSYGGPSGGDDWASAAVLGPNGRRLYLAGSSENDYLTMAYRRDGTQLWTRSYDGAVGGNDKASDAALSPDGQTLFVTGASEGPSDSDVATIAYATDGTKLWVTRYDSSQADAQGNIAVNPDGTEIYVSTGHSTMTVIAYSSSGVQAWLRHETGWPEAQSRDVAVSPDGSFVVNLGQVSDIYTDAEVIAYSAE